MHQDIDAPEDKDSQPTASNSSTQAPKGRSSRKAFASARRELSEAELITPAIQKILMDEIDRLEQENSDLGMFREKFHEADKAAGILAQKLNVNTKQEIVALGCITVGGAALGFAPGIWITSNVTGFMAAVFGVILVFCAIVAKWKN